MPTVNHKIANCKTCENYRTFKCKHDICSKCIKEKIPDTTCVSVDSCRDNMSKTLICGNYKKIIGDWDE